MKTRFILHEETAEVIRDVTRMYDEGKIEGIMVFIKAGDEILTHVADMKYIEQRGAIEVLKDNIKAYAFGDTEG